MVINHIFEDISKALDYVLVEEDYELSKCKIRQNDFSRTYNTLLEDGLDSPFSGFFNNAPADDFIMTPLCSERYCFKPNLKNRKFIFRGQSKYYTPCKSSMFRDAKDYYIGENILYQELYLLILSHPLAQLWDLGVDLLGRHYRFEVNLFGLSQHYYNKTSLLDLTSDPNVAAFFATTEYNWQTDTYSPILDDAQEGALYCYKLDELNSFKQYSSQTSENHNLSTIGLQIFPRSEKQRGFLINVPKGADFNTYPEVLIAKFKHNAAMSRYYFNKYHAGKDLFPYDILMNHWTRENKDKKVVSEQTLLLNSILNPNKEISQLRKELYNEGFTIKNYYPAFTEDEYDLYYLTAKDDWEAFCDKIHVPGDSNNCLKNALRQVPNDSRYKWAFERQIKHTINFNEGFLLKIYKQCLRNLQ